MQNNRIEDSWDNHAPNKDVFVFNRQKILKSSKLKKQNWTALFRTTLLENSHRKNTKKNSLHNLLNQHREKLSSFPLNGKYP